MNYGNCAIRRLVFIGFVSVAPAVPAQAGTEGFNLGLEELAPGADSVARTFLDQSVIPWQPPQEPVWLQPPTFGRPPPFPIRLWDDFRGLAVAPLDWDGADWKKLGLGVLAVGAVSLLDEEIDGWADRTRSEATVKVIEAYRPFGDHAGLTLLGVAWLAGRATGRPRLSAVAEDGLEATIIAAGVVTPVLKMAFGRTRPRETDRAYTFGNSGSSFPSGEATQAFAIASVIAAHSESSWVKVVAWGSAGLVGLGRIGLDGHWASDVVAGALIGAAVGQWVVRRNRPDLESGPQWTCVPTLGGDRYGLAMHVSF